MLRRHRFNETKGEEAAKAGAEIARKAKEAKEAREAEEVRS